MSKLFSFLLFLLVAELCFAQAPLNQAQYSRVKVFLGQKNIHDLAQLGLEVDHGNYRKGVFIENDFSVNEIEIIKSAGFEYKITIPDVQAYYLSQQSAVDFKGGVCDSSSYFWTTPSQYTYGSMGGYLTLSELYEVLDTMVARYPNLISVRAPIGDFLTEEGRAIYQVKMSNNPNTSEERPRILYTALHHAREPNSLSQMIFYMWYLLENYESNPEIQALMSQVEMYFIPCVNPDGYYFNETSFPNGGGLWRKNRRIEEENVVGVDLNRNYSFQWGFDNVGSSPSPSSNTYRGPFPASEPEIQAVNYLCNEVVFDIALNYHTYGNLLIHPWGYSDSITPDYTSFEALSKTMAQQNNFLIGTGISTVGYMVNGDSDDWMYGAKGMLSMTPEVGGDFWPAESSIDANNKLTIFQNITAAKLLLNYVTVSTPESSTLPDSLVVEIAHTGLQPGQTTVSVTSLNPSILVTTAPFEFNLVHLDSITKIFNYDVVGAIAEGDNISFVLSVDNDIQAIRDTLVYTYWNTGVVTLDEKGETFSSWEGNWGSTTEDFYSPDVSMTDSPNELYESDAQLFTWSPVIDLSDVIGADLAFYAKWDLEANYDYTQVLVTTDNGLTFQPMCGLWTRNGSSSQDPNQPLYDGEQPDWVLEHINLQDFVGQEIQIGFRIVSDTYVEKDGFYFDNLTVTTHLLPDPNSLKKLPSQNTSISPNPVTNQLNIQLAQNTDTSFKLSVINSLGVIVKEKEFLRETKELHLDVSHLPQGIYWLKVDLKTGPILKKFLIQRP